MKTPSLGFPVVARFVDGRVLKGTTENFSPNRPIIHLVLSDDPKARVMAVPLTDLKALFFVRTFEGNPKHVEDSDIDRAKGLGRKIAVTFHDGEVISGFTVGYGKNKHGFFVIPIDPKSNNTRIYVMTAAVKSFTWAVAPVPETVGT